jgi:hypothetical protein
MAYKSLWIFVKRGSIYRPSVEVDNTYIEEFFEFIAVRPKRLHRKTVEDLFVYMPVKE